MVATASASAQAGEMERKRKQTLERTRANHLSRQLQMRLQYARLKVEHGWQRQNLNEVENLYFHHSHRGAKTHHPQPSLVAIPSDDNPVGSSSSIPLGVAYKTSILRSATLDAVLDGSSQMTGRGTEGFPTSTPTPPALLLQTGVGSHDPSVTASSTVPEVLASQLREGSHTPSQSSSLFASSIHNERSSSDTISPVGSPPQGSTAAIVNPTPERSHLSTPSSIGKMSFSRTLSPPTPSSANQVKMPLLMHKNVSSIAKHDKFSSNKQATLTYDSFWSGLQSKSYPTLKNGGSGMNAGSVNTQSSNLVTNTPTAPLSTQSSTPNLASSTTSPPPLPLVPHLHHPSTPSSIPSSHTPIALPSTSTQAPSLLSQTASFASLPHTQQLQMQQNQPFIDSLAVWNLIASQQYPGSMTIQQGFNTGQLAGSTAAYPLLANLSATYAQAFNATAEVQGSHSQGNEIGVSGNTTPHGVGVPPSNTSASSPPVPPVPPVASAFVGQEGS